MRSEETSGRESAEVPLPIGEAAEPVPTAGGADRGAEVAELRGVAGGAGPGARADSDTGAGAGVGEARARGDGADGGYGGAGGAGEGGGSGEDLPSVPAPAGMWDDGLIARRAARWSVRRGRRAEPAEGAAEAAGSGAEPGGGGEPDGEAAEVSGGAVATAAAETGGEEPPRAPEQEPEPEREREREASPAGGVGGGCAGEAAGAARADGGRREGGVTEMGADGGTDAATAEPADGGGPGGGSDGAGPVNGGALAGGGAVSGTGSGAEVADSGSADGTGVGAGTGDGADRRLRSAWSQEPGAGAGGGDLADGGGRGDAYDGDGAAPRAAGQGTGGAHADYGADAQTPGGFVPRAEGPLRGRLDALRELVGLSRTRLDGRTLAEAGRVLDEAADRQRLSLDHAVVAIAGATGSGKSSLFNALAGTPLSEVGVRRPTTSQPAACAWRGAGDHAPTLLLERLGLPPRAARPLRDDLGLRGLVLVDLPDYDSAVDEHRARVEQVLRRVDAVIWVVDPEKYADAALHERYLQPLAGYAEVMFVVLNQVDRLPAHAVGQVLDDLRRLLDEDGVALGEHGEPGACVLALSALTGEGVADLRAELVSFIAEHRAAERRLTADVDGATARLLDVYVGEGGGGGLDERIRAEFEDRLAEAVGAAATGQAAEQRWLREAEEACGARLAQLWRRRAARAARAAGGSADPAGSGGSGASEGSGEGAADGASAGVGALMPEPRSGEQELVPARAVVEQAVRTVAEEAGAGLPAPWAKAVREAGVRGAEGLADGLTRTAPGGAAGAGQAGAGQPGADAGAPDEGEPAAGEAAPGESGGDEVSAGGPGAGGGAGATRPGGVPRPRWWSAVGAVQSGLLGVQALAVLWLAAALSGVAGGPWPLPLAVVAMAAAAGPGLALACRFAARGPARRYGAEAERRLRESAAASGRARVLEPMAAELLRYREVREQYAVASGGGAQL